MVQWIMVSWLLESKHAWGRMEVSRGWGFRGVNPWGLMYSNSCVSGSKSPSSGPIIIQIFNNITQMTEQIDTNERLDLEAMASDTLELEDDLVGIKISVCGHLEKGSGLTKFTVYLIRGEDREGPVEVYRRFSEFYALRELMLQRWPGCFVPATPDKKVIGKNDEMIITNRERFLDSFVKKMASLPYLYYSQEFQMLLRSKQQNVTDTFEKWPKPSYEDIINRYRDSFSELAGKEINAQTAVKISSFTSFLRNSQVVLSGYKDMAKRLALSRASLDKRFSNMFTRILPEYERTCLAEYLNYDESKMIYTNPNNAKIQEHGQITVSLCSKNPYWLVYDLIKFEDRDGEAFLAAIESRTVLEGKKNDMEAKIRENQREIEEISMGNSTMKSVFSRGSKEEFKIKLEQDNIALQKEKENLVTVVDIISALLAYITIDHYREAKKRYYTKVFKAVSCYEINFVQNMYDIWHSCQVETARFIGDKSEIVDAFYPEIGAITAAHEELGQNLYPSVGYQNKGFDNDTTEIEQISGNDQNRYDDGDAN